MQIDPARTLTTAGEELNDLDEKNNNKNNNNPPADG